MYLLKLVYKIFRKFLMFLYVYKVKKECRSYNGPIYVGSYSNVTSKTTLASNVNFNGMKIKGNGNVNIGENFHSGVDCLMLTSIHNYDHGNSIPYDSTTIDRDIVIGDNVWLGDRVILLGGISIGEGSIVQAGSVVVKDVPIGAIVGGHPAEIFRYRDMDHYNLLKAEGKFH